MPMAVVSLGPPSASEVEERERAEAGLGLWVGDETTSGGDVAIHYELPVDAAVSLAVYDCRGREVRSLIEMEQGRGTHIAVWDCRDDRGQPVMSGVYFCCLRAGNLARGVKVVVVR